MGSGVFYQIFLAQIFWPKFPIKHKEAFSVQTKHFCVGCDAKMPNSMRQAPLNSIASFFKPKGMKKEAIELNDAFTPCLQVDTSISLAARNLGKHSEFLMLHFT